MPCSSFNVKGNYPLLAYASTEVDLYTGKVFFLLIEGEKKN